MTVSYEEARAVVGEALGWTLVRGNAITLPADTLRALLAGPPEPSEEEVRDTLRRIIGHEVAPRELVTCADRIQALYRSRRA